jgi:hypothetical protein
MRVLNFFNGNAGRELPINLHRRPTVSWQCDTASQVRACIWCVPADGRNARRVLATRFDFKGSEVFYWLMKRLILKVG